MREIRVTVVVPVFNVERHISKCIESILAQTYSNIQVVLVDDGSTDNSGKICDSYAELDKRIEVYHTINKGSVSARRTGISHAEGEYVGFVDADDYIEANMVEFMLEKICESGADFIHTGFIEEREGEKREVFTFEEGVFNIQNLEEREDFLVKYVFHTEKGRSIAYSIVCKLYKRALIEKCFSMLPDEQQFGEDLLCLCLCILESRRIVLSRHAFYHYVIQEKSLAHMSGDEYLLKDVGLNYHMIKVLQNYDSHTYSKLKKQICYFVERKFLDMVEALNEGEIRMPRFYLKDVNGLRGKRIVIYGAGAVGRDYYAQLCMYADIEIVAWLDSNWRNCCSEYSDIVGIDRIPEYEFDKIIIAINEEEAAKEVTVMLLEQGQPKEKIMWVKPKGVLIDE